MSPRHAGAEHGRRSDPPGGGALGDRGATLVFTAVATAVLLGATALGVDLGMLITSRVQSQRAADAGALAGAQRLAMLGATDQDARDEAKAFANRHNVLTQPVQVTDGDVEIAGDTVRVRVDHTIGTLFARVLGIDEVEVGTVAAAEAVPSSGGECPLPIVAVDGWDDEDGDGLYDADETYIECPAQGCTGYNWNTDDPDNDVGMLMEVKSQNTSEPEGGSTQTCGAETPEWFCWLDMTAVVGHGNPEIQDAIEGCSNSEFTISVDDQVTSTSGNRMADVRYIKEFIDRVEQDEGDLSWDPGGGDHGCVVSTATGGDCVGSSRLIRPMAVIDPTTISGSGHQTATVQSMISIFMEKVGQSYAPADVNGNGPSGQWNVYFRVVSSPQGGTGTGGPEGSLQQTIVLIE